MKFLFLLIILISNVCFSNEDNDIQLETKYKIPLLSNEFINPCYKKKGMNFSKYYKFKYSMGKITKFTSPNDKTGKEHPGSFISMAQFIETAAQGKKSIVGEQGICSWSAYEILGKRVEKYRQEDNQKFYDLIGASFSDCQCVEEDNCEDKKADLISYSNFVSCDDPSNKLIRMCNSGPSKKPMADALRSFFIEKCLIKKKRDDRKSGMSGK